MIEKNSINPGGSLLQVKVAKNSIYFVKSRNNFTSNSISPLRVRFLPVLTFVL